MKFLCDRCKTRYSIGDERVRGKILKIRCKNCANVITVREGMPEPAAESPAERAKRSPTVAVPLVDPAAVGAGALGAAFADQLAKPPPALEEEWYVSIDGQQAGPYSLGEAQRWVRSKPYEADLHCWSEGFDDWLPVDKVSHFRGLRQPRGKPKTAPPPTPRVRPSELEPKPLFAATMASIEKSVADKRAGGAQVVGPSPQGASAAKVNGLASPGFASPVARGTAPAIPAGAPRAVTAKGVGAAALASALHHDMDPADSMTAVDPPSFNDEIVTNAEPHAARRLDRMDAAATGRAMPAAADDDNLEIGEVSRVVKLADLSSMARKPKPASGSGSGPALRAAGGYSSAARATASTPKLSPSELGMNVDPALIAGAPAGQPMPDESMVAQSFAQRHRRGMLLLVGVSAMMVLGVFATVVFVVTGTPDEAPGGLGGLRQIDTTRPEDIVRRQLPPVPGQVTPPTHQTKPRITQRHNGGSSATVEEPDPGAGKRLQASEIEDMAAKQGEGTKRCYMRAQKGALGFEIASVKKIDVTLTVSKLGVVTEVELSSHAGDTFGQCLISRIKSWKFRESAGGTYRIALAFSS